MHLYFVDKWTDMVCSHCPTPTPTPTLIKMGCRELCGGIHTNTDTDTDATGFQTHCVSVGASVGKCKICVGVGQCEHTNSRVATAQGKQGIWFLLFPDRENTGNFALTQGKILRHREKLGHRENN